MELTPFAYDPEADLELEEKEKNARVRLVITALGPNVNAFSFFTHSSKKSLPEIKLSAALLKIASKFSNESEDNGNVYFQTHVDYLKRVLGVVAQGGSALLCGEFGKNAMTTAEKYPAALFSELDEDWKRSAMSAQQNGLGLLVPPFLGIVLSRCARRDAIPIVIQDLRDEWAVARRKVWSLLDALRMVKTVEEFHEIERDLSEASRLFSSKKTDLDSQPIRIFWDIFAGMVSGAAIAKLSGGHPVIGAATGTIGQLATKGPKFLNEFGPTLFGRGAFDLAKKVRQETSQVEFDSLSKLLTDSENRKLKGL